MRQVVRTFLRDENWKYLMVKHIWKKHWSLPWGHIDEGETVYKALKREIREELNLEIKILWDKSWLEIEWIKEKPKPLSIYKIKYCILRDKEVKKLEYIFLSEIKSGEIIIEEKEIEKYDFFTKNEIVNIINTYKQVKVLASKLD